MTEKHELLTDQQFEEQFKDCTLPPVFMTHEAHLRLAYIHIKKYGIKKAVKNLTTQIAKFDFEVGDDTKFNKTITVASIKVMNHFIDKAKAVDFRGLLSEYPRLKNNFRGLLKMHYKTDIFRSVTAKRKFIKPDLPFGFSA